MSRNVIAVTFLIAVLFAACAPDSDSDDTDGAAETTAAPVTETTATATTAVDTTTVPTTTVETTAPPVSTTEPPPAPTIATVPEDESVLAIIRDHPDLTVLASLVDGLDQDTVFTQERGVTLLAPSDDAFAALGDEALDELRGDDTALTLLLSEHLAIGIRTVDDLVSGDFPNAMARVVPVEEVDGVVIVGGAAIVEGDLEATNGVIHIVDGIITPDEAG
jgi:uncharacterized surface protein with fasciclin (FAS1) repeats